MPKVIIAFDADLDRIGKTVTLDDDAARIAVREGRARYVDSADVAPSTAPTDEPPVPEKATAEPVETPAAAPARKSRSANKT